MVAFRYDLPPTLTPRQRAIIHAVASDAGLGHASSGDGETRALSVGDLTPDAAPVAVAVGGDGGDDALVAALMASVGKAFAKAVAAALAAPPPSSSQPPPPRTAPPPPPTNLTPPSTSDAASYAATILPLLAAERDAEVATARAALAAGGRGGHRLAPLRLDGWEGGLMGRTLVTLVSAKGGGGGGGKKGAPTPRPPLPAHRLGPHDLVELRPARAPPADPPLASGVVTRLTDDAVTVAFDEAPDFLDGMTGSTTAASFRLDRLANDVTHRRLAAAVGDLARAARTGGGRAVGVVGVLFGGGDAGAVDAPPPFQPYNPGLDASQLAAVGAALAAKRLALVHGPPGTGKTTTIVEIVRQLVARGDRVLLAAPSNVAVDTLVERLAAADPRLPLVRLGHLARLLPSVLSCCLDARVAASDAAVLAADARAEAKKVTAALAKCGGRRDGGETRRRLLSELRALAKEARARDAKAAAEVVSRARVVAATLTGLNPRLVGGVDGGDGREGGGRAGRGGGFDVAVVDEAAQALEPAAWAALLRAPRAVLAGDHKQLPPTVTSVAAAGAGLARTLFERAHGLLEKREAAAASSSHPCVAMLTTQYRMHASICGWASGEMYNGALTAHASVAGHTLADLLAARGDAGAAAAAATDDACAPILLIDTAGCDCDEVKESGGGGDDASTANPREAAVAWAHVRRLLASGLRDGDVGVIAPYAAQVATLRGLRPPPGEPGAGVEISTVDGFQGREKEAIVISTTRSNPAGGVGFLADARRMNVAVTRARRACALVADTETLASDPFLGRLVAWFSEHGVHESAASLLDECGG